MQIRVIDLTKLTLYGGFALGRIHTTIQGFFTNSMNWITLALNIFGLFNYLQAVLLLIENKSGLHPSLILWA